MEWITEAKLIDFFKCEAPLRRQESLDREAAGNGRWSDDLKLEPPCGDSFWSGNGDGRPNGPRDFRYMFLPDRLMLRRNMPERITDQSSYDDCRMTLKWPGKELVQWSSAVPPNLALTLASPSPTGTQASATSPPETPTFEMELNSTTRTETQPESSSRFSADSDTTKLHGDGRVDPWSPQTGRKLLKARHGDDGDGAAMVDRSNVEDLLEEDVVQAAASLLSLSNDDDRSVLVRRNVSSSSLAVIGEGSEDSASVMGKEHGHGEVALVDQGEGSVVGDGSGDGCSSGDGSSSVLSRPSNKRRYRSVVDVLKESPKVML